MSMDGIRNAQQLAEPWWQFLVYCFNENPGALVCSPFWGKVIGAFIAIGCIAVLAGCWAFVSYRRKYYAAMRAQWMRESIDEVGIKETTWDGDKAFQAELPDDEVLARVRAGIEARRKEVRTAPPLGG
jgi:hypothetical protein